MLQAPSVYSKVHLIFQLANHVKKVITVLVAITVLLPARQVISVLKVLLCTIKPAKNLQQVITM